MNGTIQAKGNPKNGVSLIVQLSTLKINRAINIKKTDFNSIKKHK